MQNDSTATTAETFTFVDTNVLVYAHDASEGVKQPIARAALDRLWASRTGTLSTQILQEFYSVATNKWKLAMSPAEAREIVGLYSTWPIVVIEPSLILTASHLHEQLSLSFWDALVLEAARIAGARRLLTEDLDAGLEIAGVSIENPFAADRMTDTDESQVNRG